MNQVQKAVPLIVAGGGGGLGIGRYLDDDVQQARGVVPDSQEFSGQVLFDNFETIPAGPGGGWRGRLESALDPHYGAALLEGSRGGIACYKTSGIHGFGGFGGGGGGCDSGGKNEINWKEIRRKHFASYSKGGGGGYSGGDSMVNSTNGEGGTSYLGLTRSIRELSFVYPGSNSGHGSVILIPAIEGCGCDYRCVALDEYRSL